MAHVPTHVLILGARKGRPRQSHRAADGTRKGRYDAERVRAGRRRLTPKGHRYGRIRIVHNCSQTGKRRGANSLKRLAPQAGFEPATLRLTAGCSAVELLRNKVSATCAAGTPYCNGTGRRWSTRGSGNR